MNTIPLITSDPTLLSRVVPLVRACPACSADVAWVSSAQDTLDYLGADLPDLVLIDFSDPGNDNFALLDAILKDSWLLHSSIIAWCVDHDTSERLEAMRGANIVVPLVDEDLERYLPRILDIIVNNQRILFQRTLGADLVQTISGSYVLDNNLVEAHCYANLVCNYLYNANKIDEAGKMHINLALTEMLINAIEHGNCGISYQEKGAWLDDGNLMSGLIEKKCQDPAVGDRRVVFEYTITSAKSTFFIADEGAGFDWRSVQDPAKKEHVQELHGRGIKLTRKYTKNLAYNDKGNEVRFEIEHQRDCANAAPGLFQGVAPIAVKAGDVIFREGEAGNFLYYIAKGRFEVLVRDTVVDELSPDDIFMGEMSFLLNNRRSATVRAVRDGTLLRISKKDFVESVKAKPQYALFLARLLARRIARRNAEISGGPKPAAKET
ncbi:MAG: cyclic nucleotide-binding domain-containing protein [Planctomycetes bacterium]|nr:cyclic nucleotide-binding domain-containing protein [Planctomycetota bacterium]